MPADPLVQVLELVAEGKVTAEEAASILEALDPGGGSAGPGPTTRQAAASGSASGSGPGAGFTAGSTGGSAPGPSGGQASATAGSGAGSLRLEIREGGRSVVNLRLPIAVGRLALDRVPGLSGEQVDRVREALSTGMRGPVLEVHDGENDVSIVLE